MIDAIIFLIAGSLILTALWLLWQSTTQAWREWRR